MSQSPSASTRVLIVCLGNICRSPIGEAVLKDVAAKRGIEIDVDSAGTSSYHVGDLPDERALKTCRKFNVAISHRARQVREEDFTSFTHILAADGSNERHLQRLYRELTDAGKSPTAKVALWGSYLDNRPIADPYYGDIEEFESCLRQAICLSHAFLDKVSGEAHQAQ